MTTPITSIDVKSTQPNRAIIPTWYRPTISPEHGVYVVLLVSFLTGAATAQHWTWATTLALICAFCGFQAEHPLVVQIRQRKSLKPRFLLWGAIYGSTAAAIALYLYWRTGEIFSPLLWIYGGAIVSLIADSISVLYREQKSIFNELITFAAVCLAAPFAYIVTTGDISGIAIGLWLMNTLFFSSSIFTVKLRKIKKDELLGASIQRLIIYHLFATGIVIGLYDFGLLSLFTALTFGIVLGKVGCILWQRQWYCTTKIHHVAMIETLSALLFCITAAISVLPVHV